MVILILPRVKSGDAVTSSRASARPVVTAGAALTLRGISQKSLFPSNAFVVYSSYYLDQRPMLGVITRTNNKNERSFTCFSRDMRFEITNAWEKGFDCLGSEFDR